MSSALECEDCGLRFVLLPAVVDAESATGIGEADREVIEHSKRCHGFWREVGDER